ncbi:MAG: hypothetical protein SNJ60_01365 [Pseudanabaenaceae cyanobacterium]
MEHINKIDFPFSDTIAGYVTSFDPATDTFTLRTTDGREFSGKFTPTTYAKLAGNLGEPWQDCTGQMRDMMVPGRYRFVYGPSEAGDYKFEAKEVAFCGRTEREYRFEKRSGWVDQIRELGNFYLAAQFHGEAIDYRHYRTSLSITGAKKGDFRQETDTISRLVYGFATAYMLTGDDRYLEGAEKGTKYLQEHMKFEDIDEGIVYWYHAIDVSGTRETKIFASEFGDDFDGIPAYEQIYALAGPIQTYRVTGEPSILRDAEKTVDLFDRFSFSLPAGRFWFFVGQVVG